MKDAATLDVEHVTRYQLRRAGRAGAARGASCARSRTRSSSSSRSSWRSNPSRSHQPRRDDLRQPAPSFTVGGRAPLRSGDGAQPRAGAAAHRCRTVPPPPRRGKRCASGCATAPARPSSRRRVRHAIAVRAAARRRCAQCAGAVVRCRSRPVAAGGDRPDAAHPRASSPTTARAPTIDTPLADVLEQRRGVCQDFAHLMIGALRMHGLAARYVSGYLLTRAAGAEQRRAAVAGRRCVARLGRGLVPSGATAAGALARTRSRPTTCCPATRTRPAGDRPRLRRRDAAARRDPRRRQAHAARRRLTRRG